MVSLPIDASLLLAFALHFLLFQGVLLTTCTSAPITTTTTANNTPHKRAVVIGVDGGTESIRACCFDANTGHVVGQACAVPYTTYHPQPGWAEQDPEDWFRNLGLAVRGAVASLLQEDEEKTSESDAAREIDICAICVDTTCCSVVALDSDHRPLRRSLLWMDQRSAPQTSQILEKCRGDPALNVNCGGEGPLSAEWMTPKALWLAQNEPDVWKRAKVICEYQDYINLKLTGNLVASSCNAAARWHWDGVECLIDPSSSSSSDDANNEGEKKYPGRPMSLYEKLGIPELAQKLPQRCLAMGHVVGNLSKEAVEALGLDSSIPVFQGGPDAFVGMIGLGCIQPGQLCLITGSSHLHCVVSENPTTSAGTWGAYRGAPLSSINFAEGGQSSTGSIVRWAKLLFGGDGLDYRQLDEEASAIPPGSEGLLALETFQGSRTPVTDPLARGALIGLTLSHTRGHIWRALLEAVCFGTRACIEGLAKAGHECDEIIMAGGATRSPLWLQLHADVSGKSVVVCENKDAPLLGCAILASVGLGIHPTVDDAVQAMVRTSQRVSPDSSAAKAYSTIYNEAYSKVGDAVRPIAHSLNKIRSLRGGSLSKDEVEVSPSLLACDWSDIKGEVNRCLAAGVIKFHVDVFDGVFIDSPLALTFGPQMVAAIRQSCQRSTAAQLECHVCVDRPARYVVPLSNAGADCFIFQFEAMRDHDEALSLVDAIRTAGMRVGVSINPATGIRVLKPLLETGLVSVVDVLAVEAGFGGQSFQSRTLEKIRDLVEHKTAIGAEFEIMVDGGVNESTVDLIKASGAQVLVAGTFLFQHPLGIEEGIRRLVGRSAQV